LDFDFVAAALSRVFRGKAGILLSRVLAVLTDCEKYCAASKYGALLVAPPLATMSAYCKLGVAFLCALSEAVKKPVRLVWRVLFGRGKCLTISE
jgi:hypothetical protein